MNKLTLVAEFDVVLTDPLRVDLACTQVPTSRRAYDQASPDTDALGQSASDAREEGPVTILRARRGVRNYVLDAPHHVGIAGAVLALGLPFGNDIGRCRVRRNMLRRDLGTRSAVVRLGDGQIGELVRYRCA